MVDNSPSCRALHIEDDGTAHAVEFITIKQTEETTIIPIGRVYNTRDAGTIKPIVLGSYNSLLRGLYISKEFNVGDCPMTMSSMVFGAFDVTVFCVIKIADGE